MVRNLLQHLDIHKSMGLDWIHPRVLRELADVLTKPFSIIYQQSQQTGEVPFDWCLATHKKGQKDDLGELQACQSDLGAWKSHGADHPECHYVAHEGQPGNQTKSAWVHERQVLIHKPDLLL
ncbi:rna-directed dna polymerase from mobile element hypothetical protein [Limosa lapponica baueri]|uniref:Rna-directed dna polymerase from mobile element jockey-like n=1 Tax=Limosa lapponica baueri TaxID=1758121 RepID=A0A2I0TZ92_LIMLA|nr:rna-directed dna polymerase from mobile element hypothetical protein [Limosa lapponica baueri]